MERDIEVHEAMYISLYSSEYMGQSFDTTAAYRESHDDQAAKASSHEQGSGVRGQ